MNTKKSVRKSIKKYCVITVATLIYAAGISLFLDPNNLAPGGVSGISIMVNRVSGIETGTLIFMINIPLLLLGVAKLGWKFLIPTFYAIIASSFFTNLLSVFPRATDDILLAALIGSALVSIGVGLVFRVGATTGGTDIIVRLLRKRYKHLKTGVIFFLLDIMIVTVSGFVFRNVETALYAAIAVVCHSVLLDLVLYVGDSAKLVYIISEQSESIASKFLEELDIGVTYLQGQGAYSNKTKQIIMCVMRNQQYPRAEEIIKETDSESFMIITNATEIYGEGYKSIFAEKM